MRKILSFCLLLISFSVMAVQNDTIKYDVSTTGIASSGFHAPFWFHNNQYGAISARPQSFNLSTAIYKDLSKPSAVFDYGFKANLSLTGDNQNKELYFHELYAKACFLVFDLSIGAREELFGNQDSTLSGGGLLFSRNSRPMPKIYAGIEKFTTVPFTYNLLEVKGGLSHGWFTDNIQAQNVLLHHKYMYLRLGRAFPVRFQYGLDHAAQWGGSIPGLGIQPTNISAYKSIFLGQSGGSDALETDRINALGNHIISQSMKLEVSLSDFRINAYWQNISEDGPVRVMWKTMNVVDGLWGLSVRNRNFPFIQGFLYEYLNTTDQSGPYHDKDGIVFGGADSYFTNGVYHAGWSYFSRTIGTPFITSPMYNSNGEIHTLNNRVQVHHFGMEGSIAGYAYRAMASVSKNYGTYSIPLDKRSTSVLLEVNKTFSKLWDIEVGCKIGIDRGEMYGNSTGGMLIIRKNGNLFRY
jgi:hypothetical protein